MVSLELLQRFLIESYTFLGNAGFNPYRKLSNYEEISRVGKVFSC